MRLYRIKPYTLQKAKQLNVVVKPSIKAYFKIDVYSPDGKLIARIGDNRYSDYPTYMETHGKAYADQRRKNYLKRSRDYKTDRGRYARLLLW